MFCAHFVFLHRVPSQLRWRGRYAGNLMTSLNCGMRDNERHLAKREWTHFKWRTFGMAYWTGETACLRQTVNVTLWEESISQLNLLSKVYCMLPYLAERWAHCRSNSVSPHCNLLICFPFKFIALLLPSAIRGKIHMWERCPCAVQCKFVLSIYWFTLFPAKSPCEDVNCCQTDSPPLQYGKLEFHTVIRE